MLILMKRKYKTELLEERNATFFEAVQDKSIS